MTDRDISVVLAKAIFIQQALEGNGFGHNNTTAIALKLVARMIELSKAEVNEERMYKELEFLILDNK